MNQQLPPRQFPLTTATNTVLDLKVRRRLPELISPAKPTPRELKLLSDIDDQNGLRFRFPFIHFYKHNPSKTNVDPVRVIRQALAETLVHFYPFAGRFRERDNRKLMVDCNGKGVLFVEAEADVILDDFGDALHPPFPFIDKLLFDVAGSDGLTDSPLMLIQVTRLKCGGFISAFSVNHAMVDATGLFLFMKTLGELARGASAPTIPPVWDRHLLSANTLPCVTQPHPEYDYVEADDETFSDSRMIHCSFFFSPTEISVIRKLIPPNPRSRSTTFEILTSFLWRCRTAALRPKADAEMRMICVINVRTRLNKLSLLPGYYGNAIMMPAAVATAKNLIDQPLEFGLRLIQNMKRSMTEEYVKSVASLMVIRGRPNFTTVRTYMVSDLTRSRFQDIDFGWGKAAYAGPVKAGAGPFPWMSSYVPFRNKKGEDGILVPICLPEPTMERFVKEVNRVFGKKDASSLIFSSL